MLTSGILTRKVGTMTLGKVTDMSFQRTLAGRGEGMANSSPSRPAQHQALSKIDGLPDPGAP